MESIWIRGSVSGPRSDQHYREGWNHLDDLQKPATKSESNSKCQRYEYTNLIEQRNAQLITCAEHETMSFQIFGRHLESITENSVEHFECALKT